MSEPIRSALVYYDADGKSYKKNLDGTFSEITVAVGSAAWGSITGTLADQTDLGTALAGKVATTRTVNGHALTGNVTVTAADVSAIKTDGTGAALPTADPMVAGALWSNSGIVTVSAG